MSLVPEGIIVPVLTPFDEDENYAPDAMAEILDFLIRAGVHAIFVAGSSSEFYALRIGEIKEIIRTSVQAVAGRVPVIAGAGAIATRDAIDLARYAENVGADALSIITPFYIHPSEEELFEHYAAIARAVALPILGYSNPARAGGVRLSPQLMRRLAGSFENIVGIKDSSGDLTNTLEYQRHCPPGFQVYIGRDSLIFDALINGCAGAVASTANVLPELTVSIFDAVRAGRLDEARRAQRKILPVRAAFTLGTFPLVPKEMAQLIGLPVGPARRPVQPLSPDVRDRLRQLLADAIGAQGLSEIDSR